METLEREIPALAMSENPYVEFFGYPEWVEEGIGSYEFWGEVGHHSQMVVVCYKVYWCKDEYSDAENKLIQSYLNENYDNITTELEDQFERNN